VRHVAQRSARRTRGKSLDPTPAPVPRQRRFAPGLASANRRCTAWCNRRAPSYVDERLPRRRRLLRQRRPAASACQPPHARPPPQPGVLAPKVLVRTRSAGAAASLGARQTDNTGHPPRGGRATQPHRCEVPHPLPRRASLRGPDDPGCATLGGGAGRGLSSGKTVPLSSMCRSGRAEMNGRSA
jgi:hypothetical protein